MKPTWDHLKLLSKAPNSAIISFCADKHVSICEHHNKTHQERPLQRHGTESLLNFAQLYWNYVPVRLQILSMTRATLASLVIPQCRMAMEQDLYSIAQACY